MKVGELRVYLERLPQDAEIMVGYDSGDYWKSKLAREIDGADEVMVNKSDYHRTYKVMKGYGCGGHEESEEEGQLVYVI